MTLATSLPDGKQTTTLTTGDSGTGVKLPQYVAHPLLHDLPKTHKSPNCTIISTTILNTSDSLALLRCLFRLIALLVSLAVWPSVLAPLPRFAFLLCVLSRCHAMYVLLCFLTSWLACLSFSVPRHCCALLSCFGSYLALSCSATFLQLIAWHC